MRRRAGCVIGIDAGTQGARAVAVDDDGRIVASAARAYIGAVVDLPPPLAEQRADAWWDACAECLRELASSVGPTTIGAIAVASTSGTFVPVDSAGQPLRPAIMYNDGRAGEELTCEVQAAGASLAAKLGYRFAPAFALPKMLWLRKKEPSVFERAWKLLHAADFIAGKLTGRFDVTDSSNALKSGYDLVELRWPRFIEERLGIPLAKLPDVLTPGEAVGSVTGAAARETGLAAGTPVVAGLTDGTASFIASGASAPGDWCSTLGTTLVLRGIAGELVRDPHGRFYSHRHPDGWWLPGGASNVGGECLATLYADQDLAALDCAAAEHLPTDLVVYPLVRTGERAPFVSDAAKGFVLGEPGCEAQLYAAYLEGVALVEQWCYSELAALGAPLGDTVRATGGGARSDVWCQLRANVLGRAIVRPVVTGAAFGAAIVADSCASDCGVADSARRLVRAERLFEPEEANHAVYRAKLSVLISECQERGYLPERCGGV